MSGFIQNPNDYVVKFIGRSCPDDFTVLLNHTLVTVTEDRSRKNVDIITDENWNVIDINKKDLTVDEVLAIRAYGLSIADEWASHRVDN